MNIPTSAPAIRANAPQVSPAAPKTESGQPIALDTFRSGIEEHMKNVFPADKIVKVSGAAALEAAEKSEGTNSSEVGSKLFEAAEKNRNRAKLAEIAAITSYTAMAASVFGGVGMLLSGSASMQGLQTLGVVGGVSLATLLGTSAAEQYLSRRAESFEQSAEHVKNWEKFLQNEAKLPPRTGSGEPIPREAFLEALEKHSSAPHPAPAERDRTAAIVKHGFEKLYSGHSDNLIGQFETERTDSISDARWSAGEAVFGAGLVLGGLAAGVTGYLPPSASLAMIAAGPVLMVDGAKKEKLFQEAAEKALDKREAAQDWTSYLRGQKSPEANA